MKKYWHVMKIGTENMLVYRFNFFFRAAVRLFRCWPPFISGKPFTAAKNPMSPAIPWPP